jgi:hypothetical protein
MKSERNTGAPLTPEDVQKILSICSPRGLLVGGQARTFLALKRGGIGDAENPDVER